jgi:uncharacterized membrane protein (UPF0136 family)
MHVRAPVRRRFEMPLVLLCGLGFSAFFSALGALVFALLAISLPFSRTYAVDGHAATRAQFLAASIPVLVAFPPILVLFAAIAYALWRELPWSRPLILAFWGANLLLGAGLAVWGPVRDRGEWVPVPVYLVVIGIVWWYLYRKSTVVAYYRVLEEQVRGSRLTEPV